MKVVRVQTGVEIDDGKPDAHERRSAQLRKRFTGNIPLPTGGVPPYSRTMPSTRKAWTRDELLVTLNLYHKLAFGQLHSRNPAIIALADKIGRGANSVAMKLNNFASLDPVLQMRGIRGLQSASALDRAIWAEFHETPTEAVAASEERLRALFDADDESEVEVTPRDGIRVMRVPAGPTAVTSEVNVRRGQSYFRNAVLNNFGGRCGVTQLDIRELLIASHILPWGKYPAERLNVRNGLCLSRLHDAAFDLGLIAFDDDLRLILSPRIKDALPEKIIADTFGAYGGQPLTLPEDAIPPDPEFLRRHRRSASIVS